MMPHLRDSSQLSSKPWCYICTL